MAGFDVGDLLTHLLLFDTYIINTAQLREIPSLVQAIGYGQTLELLSANCLKLYCRFSILGELTQVPEPTPFPGRRPLPLNSYRLRVLELADRAPGVKNQVKSKVSKWLSRYRHVPGLTQKQTIKLKSKAASILIKRDRTADTETLRHLKSDLEDNVPLLSTMMARVLLERHGIRADPSAFSLRMHQTDMHDFRAESNIQELFGLDDMETHIAIQKAIFGLSRITSRIEDMKSLSALSGFRDDETQYFQHRLGRLIDPTFSQRQRERFQRVLEIKEFPHIGEHVCQSGLDVSRFLEIRQTDECKQFREWLQTLDYLDDKEIAERINSLRARLMPQIHSVPGRLIRFLTVNLPAAVPFVNTAASALDAFLVERILPYSGPVAFINQHYPSIFAEPDHM